MRNGSMLSGGQKQKIALARAFIHNKSIIILDEATSNADTYSEQQINELFTTKLINATVIVITHKKEILSEKKIKWIRPRLLEKNLELIQEH